MEYEELNRFEIDFSGNGMIELVFEFSFRLQFISRYEKERFQEGGLRRDVFEDQLYFFVYSDVDFVYQMIRVFIVEQFINFSSMDRMLNKVDKNYKRGVYRVQKVVFFFYFFLIR